MKLSTAINIGAVLMPEYHAHFYRRTPEAGGSGEICGACALGTAMLAVTERADWHQLENWGAIDRIYERWPWLKTSVAPVSLFEALRDALPVTGRINKPRSMFESTVAYRRFNGSIRVPIGVMISWAHAMGLERLTIAKIVERFEPREIAAPAKLRLIEDARI